MGLGHWRGGGNQEGDVSHSLQEYVELRVFEKRCAALYDQGMSTYDIAARMACSQGKVAKALRRMGKPRRSFSESVRLARSRMA